MGSKKQDDDVRREPAPVTGSRTSGAHEHTRVHSDRSHKGPRSLRLIIITGGAEADFRSTHSIWPLRPLGPVASASEKPPTNISGTLDLSAAPPCRLSTFAVSRIARSHECRIYDFRRSKSKYQLEHLASSSLDEILEITIDTFLRLSTRSRATIIASSERLLRISHGTTF